MDTSYKNRAVLITETNTVVPASPLDNVLKISTENVIECTFYDFYLGEKITRENKKGFYQSIVDNVKNKCHSVTDHAIMCVKIAEINVNFLYVSLDNEIRANANNNPLYMRLDALCEVVDKIIKSLNDNCVVFFSESCRPSFLGSVDKINKVNNFTSWLSMRQIISAKCNLFFIGEMRNNDAPNNMSLGISVFCNNQLTDSIETYFPCRILTEGNGSVALGIKMKTGHIVWAIHFPLDFKGIGEENLGYKTMINLQQLMHKYDGTVCALGDFNTIPGQVYDAISQAILPEFEFVLKNELSFFGECYDKIPLDMENRPLSILDD